MFSRPKLDLDWRKSKLFGPIVSLSLGGVVLFIALGIFLLFQFDRSSAQREQSMVNHGLQRQIREIDAVIAPQVNWDDAVRSLDHKLDPKWADFNVGNNLYTFNGFTRVFVVDRNDQPVYASVNGERAPIAAFNAFASVTRELLPQIRSAEARRPPIRLRPGSYNIKITPIQANGFANAGGQTYIVVATLVQPDFGRVLPLGPRAPVAIAALPIDRAMLGAFGERYLLDDLTLVPPGSLKSGRTRLVLRSPDGSDLAALSWRPRAPGTQLMQTLRVPMLATLALILFAAFTVVRGGSEVLNELFASEARARHLAYHDPLTQLPNRALLFERLREMLATIAGRQSRVAVLCVDLDRFKEVNDTLGHHAGDLLIEAVANRLRSVCRENALISRLGGDEFVVLTRAPNDSGVEVLAHQILAEIRKPIDTEYGRIVAACSIGVAIVERAGVEPSEALRWADIALYQSKDRGRRQVTFFEPEMDRALSNRRSLEADLRQAIADGALSMVYQPQVDRNGRIAAFEALVRWSHPERGSIPPGTFIPLAEDCGLILALGELVLRQVFDETAGWRCARIAINVSPVQLRSPGFAAIVTRLVAQAGVDPARYEIELTESALLGDDQTAIANAEALKRFGFSIALDDFGTGYSSLSLLQRFSVDRIKIDRSFVSSLGDSRETGALVDATIKLALALDLAVIAEGVETQEQMDQLAAFGCCEFQGHLIGLPLPAESTTRLLGEQRVVRASR